MSASAARQARRGPAPFASFDHDANDEVRHISSPEARPSATLPGLPEHRLAPRIDISRASSSSHHDSRDSSPDTAEGADGVAQGLGFREDGAADLRSSTEELAFLEPEVAQLCRKRSTGAVSCGPAPGRHSRVSSVGSAWSCGRLSVSSAPRSPSPHRMLLETSFCGPRPLEAAPDLEPEPELPPDPPPAPSAASAPPTICTEVTIESVSPPSPQIECAITPEPHRRKHGRRRASTDNEPVVYHPKNKNRDIIRIRLNPESSSEDDTDHHPHTLDLTTPAHMSAAPSPAGSPRTTVSRKSSIASLFRPLSPRGSRSNSATGGVLSLFRGGPRAPRRSPLSPQAPPAPPPAPTSPQLLYYKPNDVIHIPLHSPPSHVGDSTRVTTTPPATCTASAAAVTVTATSDRKPLTRTVLPDGSVIIPLRSPTETDLEEPKLPYVDIEATTADTTHDTKATIHVPLPREDMLESESTDTLVSDDKKWPDTGGADGDSSSETQCARKRIVFATHVGSRDQLLFTTQLSVSGTPAENAPQVLRDTRISADSSGSESDKTPSAVDEQEAAERRRLVIAQESWEEELPRVATTLPQERPRALPMRPVCERGDAWQPPALQRPRACTTVPVAPLQPPPACAAPPTQPALRISLPLCRPRAPSPAPVASAAPAPWVNFEDVPERPRTARRITLVRAASPPSPQFVPPHECLCECHHSGSPPDDELPLLRDRPPPLRTSDTFTSNSSHEYMQLSTACNQSAQHACRRH